MKQRGRILEQILILRCQMGDKAAFAELCVRAKTLTMRQIQARLANIEMLLKKIGDDQ